MRQIRLLDLMKPRLYPRKAPTGPRVTQTLFLVPKRDYQGTFTQTASRVINML